ncbi:Peptidyl-prolyl cis-trans isomerase cyp6, variant 2 [Paraphaeosphaeria sporulosa]|uniref:Peptidyl-prolyl cis-trans isomerase n=1 Tax=Paraphaeosphaeria sporulosa TaxID=1460663 RepID=A0A177C236_9PLEO|nr:cyclophilin-like protein [Paraphaeosphaeria sporulosa]OAG00797.1 cyclophilin-like protein [Paraphaeosphaeria sporulosa]
MSVLLETSLGDITIDLLVDDAPKCCENFLKLCKLKYYNFSPVHSVQPNFSFQTGDPIGPGSNDSDGGRSIWGVLDPSDPAKKTFKPEFQHKLKHTEMGTVSMATAPAPDDPDERFAGSQFIVTLGTDIDYLDKKAAIFGQVVEGFDVLEKINAAFIDDKGRPLKDIRILHTVVLDDPYDDPKGLVEPPESPIPSAAQLATVRVAHDETLEEETDPEALEKVRREREARAQALTLEMVGDLPFAEVAPPENVLFVCKLNPVTQDEDLELIFSRFGKILSCEIIRDKNSGDSLQYAFIEYSDQKECEQAYLKMDGVLIDDHRIHVDFSQSVSKIADDWRDNANMKRRRAAGGGFGGIDNLQRKKQYRGDHGREIVSDSVVNNLVIDREAPSNGIKDRPRGPDSRQNGSRDTYEPRKDDGRRRDRREQSYHDDRWKRDRSRSPRRERRDRDGDGRYEDRARHEDRRRDRSSDRHRDSRRDRSRDRHRRDDRGDRRR